MLQVLLGCNAHILIRSKHVANEVEALSLEPLHVLKIEETVIDQSQIEWSLNHSRREAHQVRYQMLLNTEWCRLD